MSNDHSCKWRTIVETHDLCHDLDGKVGPREFAEGCAREQRKLFGCAPHADALQDKEYPISKHVARVTLFLAGFFLGVVLTTWVMTL